MTSRIMDGFIHPLLRMGKFMHRLGVVNGAQAYRQVVRNSRQSDSEPYPVNVPGYPAPLWLRPRRFRRDHLRSSHDRLAVLPAQVDDVRLIVDCGANIGLSALYLARRYPNAKILAIEPAPGNYAMLVRNTREVPAIQPVQAAVWPRLASLGIADPTRSYASLSVSEEAPKGAGEISPILLQDIVAERGRIDILKIDIEGGEKTLFEDPSCQKWLADTRVIYVELHDWMKPGCSPAFYRAITQFDFSQHHQGEIIAIELRHREG